VPVHTVFYSTEAVCW